MARICDICGKGPIRGFSIARRGLPKKKGGVGLKITGRTKRSFKPNLQSIRVILNGEIIRKKVCTTCIRSSKIQKA